MISIDFTPFQFDFISIQVFKMFFYNKYVNKSICDFKKKIWTGDLIDNIWYIEYPIEEKESSTDLIVN
jgi:uncharacterized protein (DUF2164 family)